MKMNFLKLNFLALALFFCASCQTPTTNTETAVAKDSVAVETTPITETTTSVEQTSESVTMTYRSDGFRPGLASEWISVKHAEVGGTQKIIEILYWSTADEKKIKAEIVSQKFVDGEISGYTGELRFPDDTEATGFGIIEDRFNLGDENSQEFTQEENQ